MKNTTLCYLTREDGAVLMLYRNKKKNDENAGKWVGIGGKFEEGESPEECLVREFSEETGLRLLSYRFRGVVTFQSDRYETEYMFLYTADAYEGAMHECAEGELAFIPKGELLSLPMWQGDALFFALLRENRPPFSLKLQYRGQTLIAAALDGRPLPLAPSEQEDRI